MRPNLPRREFEESEVARQFVNRLKEWYQKAATEARTLSQTRKLVASYEEHGAEIERILNQGALLALSVEDRQKITEIDAELAEQEDNVEKHKGKRKIHYKIAALRETKSTRRRLSSKVRKLQPYALDASTYAKATGVPSPDQAAESAEQPDTMLTSVSPKPVAPRELPEELSPLVVSVSKETDDIEPVDDTGDDRQTISIDVILSLLEEVLNEELSDDSDVVASIVNRLRVRINSVMSSD